MDYSEVLSHARECIGKYCKACPVCNGVYREYLWQRGPKTSASFWAFFTFLHFTIGKGKEREQRHEKTGRKSRRHNWRVEGHR